MGTCHFILGGVHCLLVCLVVQRCLAQSSEDNDLLVTSESEVPQTGCRPETTFAVTGEEIRWTSNATDNEVVFPKPPCLNSRGKPIARVCFNGTWIPRNPIQCQRIIEDVCPFYDSYCFYISTPEKMTVQERIFMNGYSLDKTSEFLKDVVLFRKSSPYGRYESVSWYAYEANVTFPPNVNETFPDTSEPSRDCIVLDLDTKLVKPEFCNKTHSKLIMYKENDTIDLCPEHCVSVGIGTGKCFCKVKEQCNNLAQISSPRDENILRELAGDDQCYVGDTFDKSLNLEGYKPTIARAGWKYSAESLSCSICTILSKQVETKLVLNFDSKHRRLHLTVYHPEGIFRGKNDQIYCYTNAGRELKSAVSMEKQFEDTKDKRLAVYELKMEKYMGMYWCEAYKIAYVDDIVKSNTIVAYRKKEGNEYALRLLVKNPCDVMRCTGSLDDGSLIPSKIKDVFKHLRSEIRIMDIYLFTNLTLDILLHVTTRRERHVVGEYYQLQNKLLDSILGNITVLYFRNAEFCLPEDELTQKLLSWPLTKIGESALPKEMCIRENGLPRYRLCGGDFLTGANWTNSEGDCIEDFTPSKTATYLYSVIDQKVTNEVLTNVSEVIATDKDLGVTGIYYLSQILKKVNSQAGSNIKVVADITDELMSVNETYLKTAQEYMNVTDEIIDSVENIFITSNVSVSNTNDSAVFFYQRNHIITFTTNPSVSNVTGLIIRTTEGGKVIADAIFRNQTFDDIDFQSDLLMASYIPEEILEDLENIAKNTTIVMTLFLNDHLFVEVNASNDRKPSGPVVSVSIPDYRSYLSTPIPILFKSNTDHEEPECAFWDYGKNTGRKRGSWSNLGGKYIGKLENESVYHVCYFSHLTHFALLMTHYRAGDQELTPETKFDFETINIIANAFTFVGLVGIFVTAACFKSWRNKPGTKILLHICLAITLEITMLVLSHFKSLVDSELGCSFIGFLLHYSVLCKFMWILVYAILQYIRFVKVLGPYPDNLLLKACIVGWGLPIIPVLTTCIANSGTYHITDFGFCYPQDLSMYLGILLPIVIIILTNFGIFCKVMYEVFNSKVEGNNKMKESCRLQIQLATLLFFVLGVPTVFVLVANWIEIYWLKVTFIYIYSITSNLEGFILFLFYVLFNGETRDRWWRLYTTKRRRSLTLTSTSSSKIS